MRDNPERFIESVLDSSWSQYTVYPTWADHTIIQAVADSMNLRIHILYFTLNLIQILQK